MINNDSDRSAIFKLGILVNPFAGIGGALALKGSDGAEIRESIGDGSREESQ